MPFKKTPSYLWQNRTGAWFFKLGIPEPLRKHYVKSASGKHPTHIVQSLSTHRHADAERLKLPLLAHFKAEFKKLSKGVVTKEINPAQKMVPLLREEMARLEALEDPSAEEGLRLAVQDEAERVAQQIQREEGSAASSLAWRRIHQPNRPTINEALELLVAASMNKAQTIGTYRLACRDLLGFLKVADCFPEDVTDAKAVAYADWLNASGLSLGVKRKRLVGLHQVWRHMRRKGWPASPWPDHQLTDPRKIRASRAATGAGDSDDEDNEEVRPFTDAEIVHVFSLPEPTDKRQRTYTRPLFRELYALGFITGMRLNELVSLRPQDITTLDRKWRVLNVPKGASKTDAGIRKIPVCHPVAVAVLDARLAMQPDPKARIFNECAPGGPDNKPSWHVSKAISRERLDGKRLGFTSEVNFHSTRRSFATLLENKCKADPIAQQRYIGHEIASMMHSVYSGGSGVEKLKQVVEGLHYSKDVERALRLAVPR